MSLKLFRAHGLIVVTPNLVKGCSIATNFAFVLGTASVCVGTYRIVVAFAIVLGTAPTGVRVCSVAVVFAIVLGTNRIYNFFVLILP